SQARPARSAPRPSRPAFHRARGREAARDRHRRRHTPHALDRRASGLPAGSRTPAAPDDRAQDHLLARGADGPEPAVCDQPPRQLDPPQRREPQAGDNRLLQAPPERGGSAVAVPRTAELCEVVLGTEARRDAGDAGRRVLEAVVIERDSREAAVPQPDRTTGALGHILLGAHADPLYPTGADAHLPLRRLKPS